MKPEDIEKLLGGYATDTLTQQERKTLFEAALADQTLFNALAGEQALRELLSDATARRQLLGTLRPSEKPTSQLLPFLRRPAAWALAATAVTVAVVVAVFIRVNPPAKVAVTFTAQRQMPAAEAPVPAPQSKPLVAPPVERKRDEFSATSRVAPESSPARAIGAPGLPRIAVLDFDDAANPEKAKKASDRLAKELDSSGAYSVVNRKDVEKAVEEQNLSRQNALSPAAAAQIGRKLRADAVVTGTITPGPGLTANVTDTKTEQTRAIKGAAPVLRRMAVREKVQQAQSEKRPENALDQAVTVVAQELRQDAANRPAGKPEGTVTDVFANTIIFDAGAKAGVKAGDRLEIRRESEKIGGIVVTKADELFSVGTFSGNSPAKVGDKVIPPASK